MIASTGVGPLNEADINSASEFGAIIFCFDVPIPLQIERLAK